MASFDADWDIQYDKEDDQEKVRTVGVEFECTITNNDCPLYDLCSEDYYEDSDASYDFDHYTKEHYNIYIPGVGSDGSEYEFVTEPDSMTFYNKGGSERFQNFVRFLKENGEPKSADGTHIHISKLLDEPQEVFTKLKWLVSNYGLQLQKIFGRVSSWAQTPAQIWFFENFERCKAAPEMEHVLIPKNYKKIIEKPYGNKQGMVINRQHTYEFRGGKGSNDIEEVLAWIQVAHNFVELATKTIEEIDTTPFSTLVEGEYIQKYLSKIQENPNRQFIAEELDQTIKSNTFIQAVTVPSSGRQLL